jgi:hypothetical protein
VGIATSGFLSGALSREALRVDFCYSASPAASPRHFIASCLDDSSRQGRYYAEALNKFNRSLAEWRWGSLLEALRELLALEDPLRAYWDTEKMKGAKPKKGTQDAKGKDEQEASTLD